MRKTLATLVGLVLAGLLLAGCSSVTSGTITGKTYEPAETFYVSTCMSYGKYGCNLYMPVPYTDPACYRLDLVNAQKETGHVCVDERTFDRARAGQQYP